MIQDRRSFLAALGAAAVGTAAVGLSPRSAFARQWLDARATLGRIGIQLYTVRRQAAADLGGTLAAIAKSGYKEVELAGYYNHAASDFRDLLRANGLTAPSGHIALELIENNAAKTFADAHTVGHDWITVPSLPRGARTTADDWKRIAERFNAAASAAKRDGFHGFAFHNHNDIVKPTGDVLPIEILMRETDPALVSYQMDLYWAVSGGADPVALLAKYPGRFRMFHVKDGGAPYSDASQTDVGAGTIDFKKIFASARGIEHYFVESDSAKDPLQFAANSYAYLSKLQF